MKREFQNIINEIAEERNRQNEKWGEQNHSIIDYTSAYCASWLYERYRTYGASDARERVDSLSEKDELTYMDILLEEVYEVIESRGKEDIRKELIQVAAVAVAMIESLDRNGR